MGATACAHGLFFMSGYHLEPHPCYDLVTSWVDLCVLEYCGAVGLLSGGGQVSSKEAIFRLKISVEFMVTLWV